MGLCYKGTTILMWQCELNLTFLSNIGVPRCKCFIESDWDMWANYKISVHTTIFPFP